MPAAPPLRAPSEPGPGPLVLASSSRYRQALLARFGWPFTAHAPEVDEQPLAGESAQALVRRLALAKARALAPRAPAALIIGSDQVAVLDGRTLGKPGDETRAIAQLEAASARCVRFLTSLCLLEAASGDYELEVVVTEVHFRALTARAIRDYVRREQPLDCAGSFKCEGLGIALFESVTSSDPTALIGLPLIALRGMLARAGVDVLADSP